MNQKIVIPVLVVLAFGMLIFNLKDFNDIRATPTEEHDHSAHEKEDPHAGHNHGDEEEVEEEMHLELSNEMIDRIGLTLSTAGTQPIRSAFTVPGEIVQNSDKTAHIMPNYPSSAILVKVRQGQWVRKGAVLAILSNRTTLSRYELKAPISGVVTQKHLSAGEVVSESDTLFEIANLSTVWAEFSVIPEQLEKIDTHSKLLISKLSSDEAPLGASVNWISPLTNPDTRRVTVRSVISNRNNQFRPGTYVTADIEFGEGTPAVAVVPDAIQMVAGETVVFVPDEDEENAFTTVVVKTGRRNSDYTEIVSGLHEGDSYVSGGAFSLKAEMVTADMDPHAGHNH